MLKVTGKAVIDLNYIVEIDVDDITTKTMSISQSDELITDAIFKKYGYIPDELTVSKFERVE